MSDPAPRLVFALVLASTCASLSAMRLEKRCRASGVALTWQPLRGGSPLEQAIAWATGEAEA